MCRGAAAAPCCCRRAPDTKQPAALNSKTSHHLLAFQLTIHLRCTACTLTCVASSQARCRCSQGGQQCPPNAACIARVDGCARCHLLHEHARCTCAQPRHAHRSTMRAAAPLCARIHARGQACAQAHPAAAAARHAISQHICSTESGPTAPQGTQRRRWGSNVVGDSAAARLIAPLGSASADHPLIAPVAPAQESMKPPAWAVAAGRGCCPQLRAAGAARGSADQSVRLRCGCRSARA